MTTVINSYSSEYGGRKVTPLTIGGTVKTSVKLLRSISGLTIDVVGGNMTTILRRKIVCFWCHNLVNFLEPHIKYCGLVFHVDCFRRHCEEKPKAPELPGAMK